MFKHHSKSHSYRWINRCACKVKWRFIFQLIFPCGFPYIKWRNSFRFPCLWRSCHRCSKLIFWLTGKQRWELFSVFLQCLVRKLKDSWPEIKGMLCVKATHTHTATATYTHTATATHTHLFLKLPAYTGKVINWLALLISQEGKRIWTTLLVFG